MSTPTEQQQTALARSRLYDLLHRIYLEGVTAQTYPVLVALPDFNTHFSLSEEERKAAEGAEIVMEQMAATYQELFGFQLFPYESIFLEGTGLLNGACSEEVTSAYRAFGYEPTMRAGAPDHLGEELGALGYLCAAEADAWEDSRAAIARRMQQTEHHFLRDHLLRWIVPCLTAIRRHDKPFFTDLATVTAALVVEHYMELQEQSRGHAAGTAAQPTWSLPEQPALLDDRQTSLKDIAGFLTTPIYSGVFFSRDLINRVGRAHRLPRGFGSREQMVTNLLRTAAQYELLPTLLADFVQELLAWRHAYDEFFSTAPSATKFVIPWTARIDQTIAMLKAIDETVILATAIDEK